MHPFWQETASLFTFPNLFPAIPCKIQPSEIFKPPSKEPTAQVIHKSHPMS